MSRSFPQMARLILLGFVVLGLLSGCGPSLPEGPDRFSVTGEATYDGNPIPKGTIYFEPDGEKGNSGPQSMAPIVEGKFTTPPGKGMIGGPHRIRIVGYDGVETTMEGEVLPDGQPLFPPYETTYDFPQEDTQQSFNVPKEGS